MPKVKKSRNVAALEGQSTRHAPLGQVMQEEEDHGKFAAPSHRSSKKKTSLDGDAELLDEKASKRILDLSRQQQLEIEDEEDLIARRRRQKETIVSRRGNEMDSSDEEDDDEESVLLDEDETE